MMDNRDSYINELIIRLVENQITEKDFCRLSEFLSKTPGAVKYYCEFIDDYASIKTEIESEIAHVSNQGEDVLLDWDFWQSIAEYEKIADPVEEIETALESSKIVISKEHKGLSLGKVNKFSLYTVIITAAALLLMIIYVQVVPKPIMGEVATLVDMIGAEWLEDKSHDIGGRFSVNNGPFFLKTGIIKIEYDEHVQVTIEGPAGFEVNSPTTIKLDYGRLYAHVFESGKGFTVDTNNSRIIDLGTEFGVQTGHDGSTELHVFKGKTTVVAFDSSRHKIISDQAAGQAIVVSDYYSDLKIREIPLKNNIFVRDICSATHVIWKGEKQISLSNIVGGGNGLDGGVLGSGWNPETGEYTQEIDLHEWPKSKKPYSLVSENPFIDGVFVPDGGLGPVVINSELQEYDGFEDTTRSYRFEISNGPAVWKRNGLSNAEIPAMEFYLQDLMLNGIPCGTAGNPAIYMHSNAGITFDLAAIRQSFPLNEIVAFSAICGKPEQVNKQIKKDSGALLSVYVFLDDECHFKQESLSRNDKSIALSLPIQPENRFLTLVVVDADQDPSYDWCLFSNPVLEFSSK